MSESAVAPVLSSHQDEEEQLFQKYEREPPNRSYLGSNWENEDQLPERIRDYYSVDELIDFLSEQDSRGDKKYKKVTLQFPDSLVADSAIVVQQLQERLRETSRKHDDHIEDNHHPTEEAHQCKKTCENCKCSVGLDGSEKGDSQAQQVWILADTAYSACCIDEVAAEHVASDIVIHFGDACLNAVQKLPVVYVFGKPYLNIEIVVAKFKETYPDTSQRVILMADAPYTRYLSEIYTVLKQTYSDIGFADINLKKADNATIIGIETTETHHKSNSHISFSNRVLISEAEIENDELIEYSLFHITTPQPPHLLFLSTKFNSITLYDTMSNSIDQGPFPSLMKRYRYMHVARTAGTIGILVNTLSLKNTTEVMNKISAMIREADKKSYMFVVGKPNVAKLANFESIDVWCILGCGQGGIVIDNTNQFYKPIITPYELELALNPTVQWSGKWVTDFESLLNEEQETETETEDTDTPEDEQSPTLEGEDEAPEFNPITGKYVSTSRPLRNIQHLEIDSVSQQSTDEGQLVKAFSQTVAIKGTVSTSAVYLQNRQWTGLGSDYHMDEDYDEEGATVEEGTGGIARGYDFDVKK